MTLWDLLGVFVGLCAAGALASLLLPPARTPSVVATVGSLAAAVMVAAGAVAMGSASPPGATLWELPGFGAIYLEVDRMAGLFLLLGGLVGVPVAIFSQGYLKKYAGRYALGPFGALYHLLLASIAGVLVAGDVVSFLIAWEAMSVLAYLLVVFEHERGEHVRAGLSMLAMGEVGTLAALVALLWLGSGARGLDFPALRAAAAGLGPGARWAVFLLSFAGFGVKAGLVPVSSWLPRAHPAAPANVSALLSGVILNLGLYGILRTNLDLAPAVGSGPGLVVVIVGSVTALVGILYATTDNDLKSMLAHSSIENMGIITAGFGASMVFAAKGHPALAGMAVVAASYHLVNHSLYKALLFLAAGSVDAQVGERDMNRLGGLGRIMPFTSLCFLIGALSIAALPPLNGFVSEWLTLQSFLQSAHLSSPAVRVVFVLCGAALALTAALAVTCFVKAFAMTFLGRARSAAVGRGTPAPWSMRSAMAALCVACLGLGVAPTYVIPRLDAAMNRAPDRQAVETLVPAFFQPAASNPPLAPAFAAEFHELGAEVGKGTLPGRGLVVLHRGGERNPVVFAMSTSYALVALLLLLGATALVLRLFARGRKVRRRPPWVGGMAALSPGMSYTATGFSNPVRVVFNAVFRPSRDETRHEIVVRHFRSAIKREHEAVHLVDRWAVLPVVRLLESLARLAARMHTGRINAYAALLLLTLVLVVMMRGLF